MGGVTERGRSPSTATRWNTYHTSGEDESCCCLTLSLTGVQLFPLSLAILLVLATRTHCSLARTRRDNFDSFSCLLGFLQHVEPRPQTLRARDRLQCSIAPPKVVSSLPACCCNVLLLMVSAAVSHLFILD